MKKAVAWSMLLMAVTLFTIATAPVMATETWKPLYAGSPHYGTDKYNPMLVGSVHVWNDGDYLYIRYVMEPSWELTETHVAVVNTSLSDIPQTRSGNPKVGHFPYKMEHDPPVTDYMYQIDLDWTPCTNLTIAAHAVVVMREDDCVIQEETAWADCGGPGAEFPGNNWATYFTYHVQCWED